MINTNKSALNKQIPEAVHISNTPDDDLINRRSDCGHQKRVDVTGCVTPALRQSPHHEPSWAELSGAADVKLQEEGYSEEELS